MTGVGPSGDRRPAGFGAPLRCPKCPDKHYFGLLKLSGHRTASCPNCGTVLIGIPGKRKEGWRHE